MFKRNPEQRGIRDVFRARIPFVPSVTLICLMLAAGCGPKADQGGPAVPSATPAAVNAPQAAAAKPMPGNLVRDYGFANLAGAWEVLFAANPKVNEFSVVDDKLPSGEAVRALKLKTDQSGELKLKAPVPIENGHSYRFSLWVKQDPGASGHRFMGVYAFDRQEKPIGVLDEKGARTPANQHFQDFNFADGQWHQVVGYLMASTSKDFSGVPADNTGLYLKMAPETAKLSLFFLNYYNEGKAVTTWAALPAIEDVTK